MKWSLKNKKWKKQPSRARDPRTRFLLTLCPRLRLPWDWYSSLSTSKWNLKKYNNIWKQTERKINLFLGMIKYSLLVNGQRSKSDYKSDDRAMSRYKVKVRESGSAGEPHEGICCLFIYLLANYNVNEQSNYIIIYTIFTRQHIHYNLTIKF